jgi:AraC family transcriptional regulator of adaptative response / DNA-3-methyladenine glycosylase II
LAGDPVIGPLIQARPGVRIPGAWGPFEAAVQAVVTHHPDLGEASARDVLARVVEEAGPPAEGLAFGLTHAFPSAESVAGASLYGVRAEVARTIKTLANQVALGNLSLEAPLEHLIPALTSIDGVSEEAAQWTALRLGARDASPHKSLGPGAEVVESTEGWRPWRALASIHLGLAATG